MFIILLVHVDNNHCWTYAPIQSSTGKTFLPDMNTNDGKPKSFTDLLSTYKKKETGIKRKQRDEVSQEGKIEINYSLHFFFVNFILESNISSSPKKVRDADVTNDVTNSITIANVEFEKSNTDTHSKI